MLRSPRQSLGVAASSHAPRYVAVCDRADVGTVGVAASTDCAASPVTSRKVLPRWKSGTRRRGIASVVPLGLPVAHLASDSASRCPKPVEASGPCVETRSSAVRAPSCAAPQSNRERAAADVLVMHRISAKSQTHCIPAPMEFQRVIQCEPGPDRSAVRRAPPADQIPGGGRGDWPLPLGHGKTVQRRRFQRHDNQACSAGWLSGWGAAGMSAPLVTAVRTVSALSVRAAKPMSASAARRSRPA